MLFQPLHQKSDKYGFNVYPLKGVYKRINDKTTILVGDNLDIYIISDDGNFAIWMMSSDFSEIEKMKNAQAGTNFTGSRRRKCYKLSDAEVSQLIGNKILSDGGVDIIPNNIGIEDLGGGLISFGF